MSIQGEAAFEAEFGRKPLATPADDGWLSGYDKARSDNGDAMILMEQEIYAWRGGQLQFEGHRREARALREELAKLKRALK